MAVVSQFDGADDYATLDSAKNLASTGEYSIKLSFNIDVGAGDLNSLLHLDSSNYFYYRISTQTMFWQCSNSTVSLAVNSSLVLGQDVIVRLTQSASGVKTVSMEGVGSGTSFSPLRTFGFDKFVRNDNWRFEGYLSNIVVYSDLAETTEVNNWNPDASVHTAGTPIITDTVAGNDATGVNMPTAALGQLGSAWIDLGGGGLTDVLTCDSYIVSTAFQDAALPSQTTTICESYNTATEYNDAQLIHSSSNSDNLTADSYSVTTGFNDAQLISALKTVCDNWSTTTIINNADLLFQNAEVSDSLDANSYTIATAFNDASLRYSSGYLHDNEQTQTSYMSATLRWSGDTAQDIGTVTVGYVSDTIQVGYNNDPFTAGYLVDTVTVNFKG